MAEGAHVDLARLRDLIDEIRGPQDGLLDKKAAIPSLLGLSPERPTSATALQTLCCNARIAISSNTSWA